MLIQRVEFFPEITSDNQLIWRSLGTALCEKKHEVKASSASWPTSSEAKVEIVNKIERFTDCPTCAGFTTMKQTKFIDGTIGAIEYRWNRLDVRAAVELTCQVNHKMTITSPYVDSEQEAAVFVEARVHRLRCSRCMDLEDALQELDKPFVEAGDIHHQINTERGLLEFLNKLNLTPDEAELVTLTLPNAGNSTVNQVIAGAKAALK